MSGALGSEQLKKLPSLVAGRRKNGEKFSSSMANHPIFRTQSEIGESSWFGFALVIRQETGLKRADVVKRFGELGFDTRPIVSGNFTKNPVLSHMEHSLHGEMVNAEDIDRNGFFIGNHHYDFSEAIETVAAFRG